ncbi:MAG: acyl-CoA/acyl-ACP dehydrogenase [Gammaproteobacteria bacterium]|nr:acyl-CoA/acyl-ACP dehydrogenase [Gammaproteobacteria bacterium]
MEFAFTDEQNQLRETVAQFLESRCPIAETRNQIRSTNGHDQDVWRSLVRDLGLGGIHAPVEQGGAGLSYVETCIVLEEMGRALYSGPFLSSNVLSVNALMCCEGANTATFLTDVVSGDSKATLAFIERNAKWNLQEFECSANNGSLSGEKTFVFDGPSADLLIIAARSNISDRYGLYAVEANSAGIDYVALDSIDLTRRLSTIRFDSVKAIELGAIDESKYQAFLDLAVVALANEMIGGAQRMLDSAVEYASTRVQFGRTIGSLQAIKHKCAELLLDVELAKSACYRAAEAMDHEDLNRSQLASIAKAMASDVFVRAALDCIQVHGGIGFTWENDTHLWYRRAKSSEVYLGDSSFHRERYLQELGV